MSATTHNDVGETPSPPAGFRIADPWRHAGLVVLVAALLPFVHTRNHPFVHDDHDLRGPSSLVADARTDAALLWTADLFGSVDEPTGQTGFWRPLVLWSFHLEHRLTGGAAGPTAWLAHLVNMVLHALATWLLWCLIRRLGLPPPAALLAAVLFAVHPIHAAPVTWTSAHGELAAPALAWGGTLLLLTGRARNEWAALVLFAAALLCKETALLLVGLAAPLVWAAGGTALRGLRAPVLAILAVLLARLAVFEHGLSPEAYTGPADLGVRWLTWLTILPDQVAMLLWPGPSSPVHPVAAVSEFGQPAVLAGLAVLMVTGAGAVWALRKRAALPLLCFGLLAGTMLLTAPWTRVPTGYRVVAAPLYERYLYAAAAAPGILLALGLAQFLAAGRAMAWLPVVLLGGSGALWTAQRTEVWSDDGQLARAGLAAAPESADLWTHLGYWHLALFHATEGTEDEAEARAAFERALSLEPGHRLARLNRFLLERRADHQIAAATYADDLLRRFPEDPAVLDNLAGWHMDHGRWNEAAALLQRELSTDNALPGALQALRLSLRAIESQAIESQAIEFQANEALESDPAALPR